MRTLVVWNACVSLGLLLCGGALWLGRALHSPDLVALGQFIGILPMVFAGVFFVAIPVAVVYALLRAPSGQAVPLLTRARLIVVALAPTLALVVANAIGALLFFAAFNRK
jgi:hypothetical protein